MYGGMIWGILPMEEKISWEGHLLGMIIGIVLAYIYKLEGPVSPKYRYEIEKELGIEPIDLEGILNERIRLEYEREVQLEREKQGLTIVYHYIPEVKPIINLDENVPEL